MSVRVKTGTVLPLVTPEERSPLTFAHCNIKIIFSNMGKIVVYR